MLRGFLSYVDSTSVIRDIDHRDATHLVHMRASHCWRSDAQKTPMNLDAVGLLAAANGRDPADGLLDPGSPADRRPVAA